jgi:hypothetical protein
MNVPGMPEWQNTTNDCGNCVVIYTTFPTECTSQITINTSQIIYNGPDLPNSGIVTGDSFTTMMEKIDAALA